MINTEYVEEMVYRNLTDTYPVVVDDNLPRQGWGFTDKDLKDDETAVSVITKTLLNTIGDRPQLLIGSRATLTMSAGGDYVFYELSLPINLESWGV